MPENISMSKRYIVFKKEHSGKYSCRPSYEHSKRFKLLFFNDNSPLKVYRKFVYTDQHQSTLKFLYENYSYACNL